MCHSIYVWALFHEMSSLKGYQPLKTVDVVEAGREETVSKGVYKKQDILHWLQSSDEHEVFWVLHRLHHTSPHVFEAVLSDDPGKKAEHMHADAPKEPPMREIDASNRVPLVQFTSSVFFAEEGKDDIMVLDVMRIGNFSGKTEVYYETQDDSALSGRSYTSTSGKLVFQPGDTIQHVEIPIINNTLWDTTTEFRCILQQEGLTGGVLGQYLYQTRVKIIDNNAFPTDAFAHLTSPEALAKTNKWKLFLGYCSLVSNIPGIWCGTIKYALVDVNHNLWHLLQLFTSVYMLDYVIDVERPESELVLIQDRKKSLMVLATLSVVSIAVAHLLDYHRLSLPVVGPARNFIQRALLRKFLNYKFYIREFLKSGDVQLALQRDAPELVINGYVSLLKMMNALGKMACMISFKLVTPYVFGTKFDWHGFVLFGAMPVLLVLLLCLREEITSRYLKVRNECHSHFVSFISKTTTINYNLVLGYSLRNHCEHQFIKRQADYGASIGAVFKVLENNMYLCKWCQSLITAAWILYGGMQVFDGELPVGLFVTNLQIIQALGATSMELFSLAINTTTVFPGLENVTALLNHPTDVSQRYRLKRAQREETKRRRSEAFKRMSVTGTNYIAIDHMPIVLNFERPFQFEGKDGKYKDITLNFKGYLEIHQGQMVAVVGKMGSGKATLLRLLSGVLLPGEETEAPIFTPSHLRVANVADEPLFFDAPLYENLIFGMDASKPAASRARCKAICERLTDNPTISEYLEHDEHFSWSEVFSGAQIKLLSIARALVQNYEVLCIHKPLANLRETDIDRVINSLHNHIRDKGLELTSDIAYRRPRTIIISSANVVIVRAANNVLEIGPHDGLHMVPRDSIERSSSKG